jgi:hypothetical protein
MRVGWLSLSVSSRAAWKPNGAIREPAGVAGFRTTRESTEPIVAVGRGTYCALRRLFKMAHLG